MPSYIPAEIRQRVYETADARCGYCLSPQHLLMAPLEIEHIIPTSKGGSDAEENLWLACPFCNKYKSDRVTAVDPQTDQIVPLFNPRQQNWSDHFQWTPDGLQIVGLTPIGRATVLALRLDSNPTAITVRRYWVQAGWHPPHKDWR